MARLGEYDISTETDCVYDDDERVCADPVQDINVRSTVSHPDYNKPKLHNDIGLVQLERPIVFKNHRIGPICLPLDSDVLPKSFAVFGWGATSEHKRRSNIIQKALVPLYDSRQCEAKFNTALIRVSIDDGQFCAGGQGKIRYMQLWVNQKNYRILGSENLIFSGIKNSLRFFSNFFNF